MNFQIGLSGLRASQFALSTVAQNLANANTEGYHRQTVSFQTRLPQQFGVNLLGRGVEIRSVDRVRSQILESSYTNALSDLRSVEQRLSIEGQIESLFLPGQGSLQESLSGFFDELSTLSANPTEIVQRNSVVRQGVNLAQQIRDTSNQLTEIKTNVGKQIELEVAALNGQLRDLVALQTEIKIASVHGTPNDLLDRRDQLINSIAEKIDIQRTENVQDGFGLSISEQSISIGLAAFQFETATDNNGNVTVRLENTQQVINFKSGSIPALQHLHSETIDSFKDKLNEVASGIIRNIDQVHAKGIGGDGAFSVLKGSRPVEDVDAPLATAGTAFPIESGDLFFSVTDSTGNRRTHKITIDPQTDSLRDVANKIAALPGLQANISSQTKQLSISSSAGFKFDFSGNLETVPDLATFTGSSIPQLSGRYEGDENQTLTVQIVGSGEIGITPGLQAQVLNSAGEVVKELEIGEGYEAGSELDVIEGVKLSFSAGDIVDSESFQTQLVANSDETGALSAFGLNTFFVGTSASDIDVSTRIVEDPNQLATSKTGDNGDTFNLAELVGLRDELVMSDNRLSFDDYLGEVVSEIGFQVQTSASLQLSVSNLKSNYEYELQSVSGIDLNEEMLNLAKFQKSYEASVQVIRTMETMMDDLYRILR